MMRLRIALVSVSGSLQLFSALCGVCLADGTRMMCRNFGVSVGNHRNTSATALLLGFRCDEWIIDCLASMVQYLPHLSQCLTDSWCEAGPYICVRRKSAICSFVGYDRLHLY
jgi:hypothetical protein